MAGVWAELLGIPLGQIGRGDSFFDLGGTSLTAVRLAVAVERAVSHKDVTRHPVLADLALTLDAAPEAPTTLAGVPSCS